MWKLRVGNISEIIFSELGMVIKPSLSSVVKDKVEEFLVSYVKRNIFKSFEGEIEFGVFLKILKFRKGLLRDLEFYLYDGYAREREIDLEAVKKDMVFSLLGFPMKKKAYYKLVNLDGELDFCEEISNFLDEYFSLTGMQFSSEGFGIEIIDDVIEVRGFEDIFVKVSKEGAVVLSRGGGFYYNHQLDKALKLSKKLDKYFEMKSFLDVEILRAILKEKLFS